MAYHKPRPKILKPSLRIIGVTSILLVAQGQTDTRNKTNPPAIEKYKLKYIKVNAFRCKRECKYRNGAGAGISPGLQNKISNLGRNKSRHYSIRKIAENILTVNRTSTPNSQ